MVCIRGDHFEYNVIRLSQETASIYPNNKLEIYFGKFGLV